MEEAKPGYFYFASESVGEGHPDKLCDQISDGVLDAALTMDKDAKVAMESATKTKLVSSFLFLIPSLHRSVYWEKPPSMAPDLTTNRSPETFARKLDTMMKVKVLITNQ